MKFIANRTAMPAAFVALIWIAVAALGQSTEPSVAVLPATAPSDLLGPVFTSNSYSIQFRPPAGSVEVQKFDPQIITTFDRQDYDWHLRAWRVLLDKPQQLSIHKDQMGQPHDGVLEGTLNNLRDTLPNARVLRNEVINVGKVQVGMIALRYETASHDRRLLQQALFHAPDADDMLYYCLELNTPAKPFTEPDTVANPGEKLAYATFAAVTDSTVLLDFRPVAEDQRQRLNAARAIEVSWSGSRYAVIRDALQPEQWQRLVRDGKDVGYSYILQDLLDNTADAAVATLRVGIRTHMEPAPGIQWDTGTWYKGSLDRKHENWTFEAKATSLKGELIDSYTQIGTTDEQTRVVTVHPKTETGDPFSRPGTPEIQTVRNLQITTTHGPETLNPIQQETPQFYLTANYAYLLPRILPLNRPCGYMWVVFVPSTPTAAQAARKGGVGGYVLSRYLDVLPVAEVHFNGRTIQAITVNDRITLDGVVTSNYFTPDGKFVGSSVTTKTNDRESTLVVLPTDAATIQRIWPQSELTRPRELPAATAPAQ